MNVAQLPGIKQFELTDKLAIITGGSKGLGLAMAAGLASGGAKLMLVNRTLEDGEQAAQSLKEAYGVEVIAFAADVCKTEDMQAMAAKAMEHFGRLDILINNAGINIRGPIDELQEEEFRRVMDVNVHGLWLASRAVTPHMKSAGSGKIINISSTLGLVGLANRTPYATSKGAVIQMTRALGLELAPFGINVNAICPGPFLTEMNIPFKDTPEYKKFVIGATAVERWAELKEIQGAAIFLASEASSYMVGSVVTVDGGWTAK